MRVYLQPRLPAPTVAQAAAETGVVVAAVAAVVTIATPSSLPPDKHFQGWPFRAGPFFSTLLWFPEGRILWEQKGFLLDQVQLYHMDLVRRVWPTGISGAGVVDLVQGMKLDLVQGMKLNPRLGACRCKSLVRKFASDPINS